MICLFPVSLFNNYGLRLKMWEWERKILILCERACGNTKLRNKSSSNTYQVSSIAGSYNEHMQCLTAKEYWEGKKIGMHIYRNYLPDLQANILELDGKKKKKNPQNQELINIESKCLPLFSIFSFLFPSAVGHLGLPWWLSGKKSPCNVVDPDLIPESGRSPGEGNGNPLWNSCLGNSMNRGGYSPWVAKSQTWLSD